MNNSQLFTQRRHIVLYFNCRKVLMERSSKMLPKTLKCFSLSYCFAFWYGLLPFRYKNGTFETSALGVVLWFFQLLLVAFYTYYTWYIQTSTRPWENPLSCAIFIQHIINNVSVLLQVLIVVFKRKQMNIMLNYIVRLSEIQYELSGKMPTISWKPIVLKILTLSRCVFMYLVKRLQPIEVVPFLCVISQIGIEHLEISAKYIAANSFATINKSIADQKSTKELRVLQKYHNIVCDFCTSIEKMFSGIITISVFAVSSQLLLMAYFEISLNIKPIPKTLLVHLYLLANILYSVMNLYRIVMICVGNQRVNVQYRNTILQIENVSRNGGIDLVDVKYLVCGIHLRRMKFSGSKIFAVDMELISDIVSVVMMYTVTMVTFTTFAADTSAIYSTYVKTL